MALATDNKTLQLLRTFARRRRRLILLRGLAATTLALVVGMLAVALADRLIIMEMPLRISLSLAAYAAAVAVAWMSAGRHLVKRERPSELARMIESAEPTLRDRLLAAVELGEWANGAAAFREIVRDDAARRAAAVRVEKALPWRLIAWWVGAGAGAVALCAILLAVPNLQFGRMLSRALLPTAEIPRASRYTVAFAGGGDARLVPGNEATDFEVLVSGGAPDEVTLEIRAQDQPTRSVPMEPVEGEGDQRRYRAAVTLDRPATLRAWADDADSRLLAVDVRPRPGVLRFTKQYTPPVYLANRLQPLPPVTEESGALEALHGSTAQIELAADQPIRSGFIELLGNDGEPIAGGEPIALVPGDDATRLRGALPIQFDGAYRVQLVAEETGFETRHAPLWPVKALTDLPPVIQAQASEGRPIGADALLGLRATVTDDVGLAWLRRDMRINGGDWQAGAIEDKAADPTGAIRQVNWSGPMDLLPMALMPGDRIESRLVVSDLKGGQAIGSFGEWVIVSDGLDDARIQALAAKRQVAAAAGRLAAATAQLEVEADAAVQKLAALRQQGAADSIQIDQVWLTLAARAQAAEDAADELLAAATAGLTDVAGGRDARDMARIGDAASRLRREVLADFTKAVESPAAEADSRLAAAQSAASTAAELAGAAVRVADAVVNAEQTALATQEVWVLAEEFATQLAAVEGRVDEDDEEGPDEALAWQQITRGSATLAARLQGARERLDEARPALATQREELERVDEIRILLDRAGERLRASLREAEAQSLSEALSFGRRAMAEALPHLGQSAIQLEQQLEEARDALDVPPAADSLAALAERLDDPMTPWHRSLGRLGDRATLQERRADLDRDLLSDLALARQAVRAMQAAAEQVDSPAGLAGRAREVAEALRVLEAGHGVADLHAQAKLMEQAERLESSRFNLDRWRDWLGFTSELERAAEFLDSAGHEDDAVTLVGRLGRHRSARAFGRSLERPRDAEAQPQAADAMAAMAGELASAAALIEPAMRTAREVLAAEALPLSDWMDQLADQSKQMAEATRAAPDAAAPAEAQEAFEDRRAELEEAIRHDAQQQDLATEPGRQRLRDADDAIAMLQNDSRRAREQLDAAKAADEAGRPEALQRAAEAQEKAAQTLRQLAEHYRNLERGSPEDAQASRQELREAEAELGLKERLDAEYERMQRLAEMEQLDDQQMLEALEKELEGDEAMQRELGRLADEAAREGRQQLDAAAQRERAAESDLNDAQQQQERADRSVKSRAEALAETARALANEKVPEIGKLLEQQQAESGQQVDPAREALNEAADAAEQGSIERAAESLREAAESLEGLEQSQAQRREDAATKLQNADEKAAAARQVGGRDLHAEEQRLEAANEMNDARQIQRQAARTRREVEEALEEAARSQQAQERSEQQAQSALEETGDAQDRIARDAESAAEALDRAARHEERLGNQEKAQAMEQAAQSSRQAGQEQVPAAEQAARQSQQPGEAAPAVSEARQALEQGSSAAKEAAATPDQSATPGQSDRAGSMMAQALDQLDRLLNGQQGQGQQGQGQGQGQQAQGQGQGQQGQGQQGQGQQGQGQQGQGQQAQGQGQGQGQGGQGAQPGSEMARAMAQRAADAQARAMRNRRLPSTPNQPADGIPSGADLRNIPEEAVQAQMPEGGGDWGRLPPEVVKDLLQGQRDAAPAEYRDLVEAYYRAIAERARQREEGKP